MLYTTFVRLLDEANKYEDSKEFIMSLGWQPWMDKEAGGSADEAFVDADAISGILELIHELSGVDFKGLRKRTGLSMAKMAAAYQIPLRTIENWDAGERGMTSYDLKLLKYTVFIHEKEGDDGYVDLTEQN